MQYVVKMFDKYYMKVNEDSIDEIYDLESATIFSSKAAAIEATKEFTMTEHCNVVKHDDVIEDFLKWKDGGMVRRNLPKLNKIYSRDYDNDPLEVVIDWTIYKKEHENKISYEHYTTWPNIGQFCKNFYDVESYYNDDYSNMFHTFRIKVDRDNSFKDFEKEYWLLDSYVTFEDDDGGKIYPIVDHELSEYDSRSLYVDGDSCKIVGRFDILFEGTLEECFNEIRSRYYYD